MSDDVFDKVLSRRSGGMPRYDEKHARWLGLDKYTLYAFEDVRTGSILVRPGDAFYTHSIGPAVRISIATRAQAEQLWQSPLHSGWKVRE